MGNYTLLNQDVDTSFVTLEMTWRGIRHQRIQAQLHDTIRDPFQEVIRGRTINTFMIAQQAKSYCHACAQLLLAHSRIVQTNLNGMEHIVGRMSGFARSAVKRIPHANPRDLSTMLQKATQLQVECVSYGAIAAFADVFGEISDTLVRIVRKRKNLTHPIHEYTTLLGSPQQKSNTERAYHTIHRQHDDQGLLTKYFWLDQGYVGRGLTRDELKAIRSRAQPTALPSSRITLLRELRLNEAERRIFWVSQGIIRLKNLRADMRQCLHVVINRIVDRLSAEWGMGSQLIEMLSVEEMIRAITDRTTLPSHLQERWEHSVYIPCGEKYTVLTGANADRFLRERVISARRDTIREMKGTVAYHGYVRGRVALVFGPQHNAKVVTGDILVATATSPQLLPAMRRAAAFITDVGGITSHAAIVARELKIPCIVGTKIATQVLKDGDRVEVDATKGVVRKIH